MDVEELAPRMGPARGLDDVAAIEFVEAGIAVRLQNAFEGFEMLLGMFTLAVGRVAIECGRRRRAPVRTLVAHIDPEPSRFRLAGAGRKHRDRRVVAVNDVAGEDMAAERGDQRLDERGAAADPSDFRSG